MLLKNVARGGHSLVHQWPQFRYFFDENFRFKERYGTEFYSEIGKRGGETVKQERGAEYYSTIGRKGGEVRTVAEKPEVQPADVNSTDVSTAA